MTESTMQVRVKRISYEAENINSYELVTATGGDLAPFAAGSHIDLHLPNGMIRSYSLVNDQRELSRYVIAVNKDAVGRGGSRFIHETIRAGDILIAGGIGITPLMSMVRRLEALGRKWKLFYAARTRCAAAFLDELNALRPGIRSNLHIDLDDERSGRLFDLGAIVRNAPFDSHLYCCGPVPMLEAFEAAAAGRPPHHVHVEYFKATEKPAAEGGFEVMLARSNRTIKVQPGKTILDALLDAGIAVNYACTEGVCGTCETRVLDGVPDHRDLFLSKEEHATNKSMMICCSGAKSPTLLLDI
jgi:ferredoxin-NADP reductase